MIRIFISLGVLILFIAIYSVRIPLRAAGGHPPALPEDAPSYLEGVIHAHSKYSDGSGSISEISAAAKKANLDFVILTDHNSTLARKMGEEKNRDGVDLFVEMEASTPNGHLLSFHSLSEDKYLSDPQIQEIAWKRAIHQAPIPSHYFSAVSHPTNLKIPWRRQEDIPEGLEIVNLDSVWRKSLNASPLSFLFTALLSPWNEYLSALRLLNASGVNPENFRLWDKCNEAHPPCFGILGQDTHANIQWRLFSKNFSVKWPSYETTFLIGRNVVFLNEPRPSEFKQRKEVLYQSLQEGRIAVVFSYLSPFQGNDWSLRCNAPSIKDTPSVFRSGDRVSFSSHTNACHFHLSISQGLPYRTLVKVIRNSKVVIEQEIAHEMSWELKESGTYRAEVWVKKENFIRPLVPEDIPYIFYNPIFIK